MNILITGGAGYIGVHCCVSLIEAGYKIVILDNFSTSSVVGLQRIQEITGVRPKLITGDVRDAALLESLFKNNSFSSIIHMAGLKSVHESVLDPLIYYHVNVEGARALIEKAIKYGVNHFLFSSSATVYGQPEYLPIDENHPLSTTNPYGETKRVIEEMLKSVSLTHDNFKIGILRYFNPVGAHLSGRIGEDPKGAPNNLLPFVAQVAIGRREYVQVYGGDYDTKDGTGVRDYIHVVDLANAHKKALEYLLDKRKSITLNLGTGKGYSVLEVIRVFSLVSGRSVPYKITERRSGDVASCFTDPSFAKKEIAWEAEYDLSKMCQDHWRWQSENPNGY